jgi:hypothetical protein
MEPWVPLTQMPQRSSFVDASVVQQCDNVPSQMVQDFPQEHHNIFLRDVVPEEHPKQSQSSSRWAH